MVDLAFVCNIRVNQQRGFTENFAFQAQGGQYDFECLINTHLLELHRHFGICFHLWIKHKAHARGLRQGIHHSAERRLPKLQIHQFLKLRPQSRCRGLVYFGQIPQTALHLTGRCMRGRLGQHGAYPRISLLKVALRKGLLCFGKPGVAQYQQFQALAHLCHAARLHVQRRRAVE